MRCQFKVYSVREHCRPTSRQGLQQFGYPSLVALADALKGWFRAHEFGLGLVSNIHAYTSGGIDYVLSAPRAIVFQVSPRPFDANRSPAERFDIKSIAIRDKGDQWGDEDNSSYKLTMQGCVRQAKATLKRNPRTLAGVLPVIFHVVETNFTLNWQYPVFHIQRIGRGSPDRPMRLILDDLVTICVTTILAGYSFARPDYTAGDYVPAVLEMKKERRRWKWAPIEDGDAWETIASFMRDHFKSGLHPRVIWTTFYQAIQGTEGH